MALAVCLLFDADTDRAVRRLWERLEDDGISTLLTHTHCRHVPHLSYAVLRTYDTGRLLAALDALPAADPIPLRFDAVGLFRRGRACLIPAPTADLLVRQELVVRAVESTGAELHRHYRPRSWTPHCSLSPRTRRDELPRLTAVVYDVLPIEATVTRAELIDTVTGERYRLQNLP
ncbi:2'-5' RNA ligase family protein [Rhodococcus sp. HNM0563]|uniref:2'-5' RNA ligase family protein n=1 Tax=unclassified Rhodococcus (in: high G+C Gram-positive bacteria) TaxID=192944 RepID=UPI00146D2EA0|nr:MULTISPECIES: 2'-5' RNA ligase family protein [unclassified Rhodococcus (in: high G+C Gram-positive bacteria)]MCK0089836.1 2'-5' RNA ligase family protein [Rhodococcus sp. F64268]NLU62215.1 2'-5' RNA ligase family protein [Rhodococcus sp. HNM0563]